MKTPPLTTKLCEFANKPCAASDLVARDKGLDASGNVLEGIEEDGGEFEFDFEKISRST